jgi:alpha-galactosidase
VSSNPRTAEKTLGLWERDVCEIFIAPDPATPNHYFEFEAAPTGEWLDVAIQFTEEGRQSDWEFQSQMTVAAKAARPRLLISMRIPWSEQITKPTSGALWRVNFFRCVDSGAGRGYLAWRPTLTEEPNFHVPAVFGLLQFE